MKTKLPQLEQLKKQVDNHKLCFLNISNLLLTDLLQDIYKLWAQPNLSIKLETYSWVLISEDSSLLIIKKWLKEVELMKRLCNWMIELWVSSRCWLSSMMIFKRRRIFRLFIDKNWVVWKRRPKGLGQVRYKIEEGLLIWLIAHYKIELKNKLCRRFRI